VDIQDYISPAREVSLRGIMEAPSMDADNTITSINLAQVELDRSRAIWAAEKPRRIAETDALNQVQPGDKLDGFPGRS
jgi:hypothetical protein